MTSEKLPESSVFDIDWTSINDDVKVEILIEHVKFIELSRNCVRVKGAAHANVRSLLLAMLISLIMALNEADNKTIILTILGVLFAKASFSKLLEAGMTMKIESAKKDLAKFMSRKIGRNLDA